MHNKPFLNNALRMLLLARAPQPTTGYFHLFSIINFGEGDIGTTM